MREAEGRRAMPLTQFEVAVGAYEWERNGGEGDDGEGVDGGWWDTIQRGAGVGG